MLSTVSSADLGPQVTHYVEPVGIIDIQRRLHQSKVIYSVKELSH